MVYSKEAKPRLYLDIDGVIYGWYGGRWQIRPYTSTLINWAKKYFDVKRLPFNSHAEMIGSILYVDIPKTNMSHNETDPNVDSYNDISKEYSLDKVGAEVRSILEEKRYEKSSSDFEIWSYLAQIMEKLYPQTI